jgi:hypothetical protein
VLAVVLSVMTARLGMVLFGVTGMAVGAMSMVCGLFVIAGLVVLGGFVVMLGGVLMMFGGLAVMFNCVFAHLVRSRSLVKVQLGYATHVTIC